MAVTADVVDNAERTGMRPREILEFFVLLPFGLGLFLGAARIGSQQFDTVGHHMAYASLLSGFSWACYGTGSKVMSWLLRPWKPSLLAVLMMGHIAGGFTLWWPLRDVLNAAFEPFLVPGSGFGPFWPPQVENLGWYIAITLQGMGWWLLANWLDFRYRRVPRFGFAPTPGIVRQPEAAAPAPATASIPDAPDARRAVRTPPRRPAAGQPARR